MTPLSRSSPIDVEAFPLIPMWLPEVGVLEPILRNRANVVTVPGTSTSGKPQRGPDTQTRCSSQVRGRRNPTDVPKDLLSALIRVHRSEWGASRLEPAFLQADDPKLRDRLPIIRLVHRGRPEDPDPPDRHDLLLGHRGPAARGLDPASGTNAVLADHPRKMHGVTVCRIPSLHDIRPDRPT